MKQKSILQMAVFYVKRNRQSKLQMISVKHMKHSIKPYSKDISEVQRAFYKSTMNYLIPAWCIKEKMKTKCKRRSKICSYHVNETNLKTYRYLLKKEGMPSGASPNLDA